MADLSARFVASPCCLPQLGLVQLLHLYRDLGFRNIELFTAGGWPSAVDPLGDADAQAELRTQVEERGMRVTSMHLPPITAEFDVAQAVTAARFARGVGADVVLFKATTRDLYIESAGPYLEATAGVGVTPVLQNHAGAAISTLDDFRAVLAGIGDPRMRTLLEVGHFARVGVDWRDAYDVLGESIALVHVNDIDGNGRSVPFGTGTVDFEGLLKHLDDVGYTGNIVVELELEGHTESIEPTVTGLRDALDLLGRVAS
ncbi:sugar phosphate isomerase/epimerase family protein [Tenggerimyces flavus]|uniref:Sugar phosphate isomerase/epimerase family protein n=1 Tax=Tenggerimyces flavus TaxID=1708749 RepID=A0ABV7YNB2_9ACTN|nr:sugar phosphate isomerase/epimerase family protein [Tenggerimyces flavus]MBM7789707.1 sugar phosphate isomerase/epimerase [Tenggerimyces flavus]